MYRDDVGRFYLQSYSIGTSSDDVRWYGYNAKQSVNNKQLQAWRTDVLHCIDHYGTLVNLNVCNRAELWTCQVLIEETHHVALSI